MATDKWGLILADESIGATSRAGVFAAGDNVHGPDLVITAIAAAHRAAASIDAYLQEGDTCPLEEDSYLLTEQEVVVL
jgi:glutamate synthase (NADPH) small chain